MIFPALSAPPQQPRAPDITTSSPADDSASLTLYGLESACGLLGGRNAWVTRHTSGKSQTVALLDPVMEIDSLLNSIVANFAENIHLRQVMVMPWKHDTLLCASLSAQPEADGCIYMLNMIFGGPFELTERLAGVVDGLRCSLQALISKQISGQRLKRVKEAKEQPVTCCCCRRMHTTDLGWMHWDDFRFLKTGHGSSHTVCEQCALALYGEVLQGKI